MCECQQDLLRARRREALDWALRSLSRVWKAPIGEVFGQRVYDAGSKADYRYRYTGGGQTDWFLPSKDQLNAMYDYKGSIVDTATYGFASGEYWTSSEDPPSWGWSQRFSDGSQLGLRKDLTASVRPVRAF